MLRCMVPRTVILKRLREKYGVSSATSSRDLSEAQAQMVEALEVIDRKQLISQIAEVYMHAAELSFKQNNPGAAVAAAANLAKLIGVQ